MANVSSSSSSSSSVNRVCVVQVIIIASIIVVVVMMIVVPVLIVVVAVIRFEAVMQICILCRVTATVVKVILLSTLIDKSWRPSLKNTPPQQYFYSKNVFYTRSHCGNFIFLLKDLQRPSTP